MEIQDTRRERLAKWFSTRSIPEREKSYISQLLNKKASFGEKAARRLERDYDMGDGYLDSQTADTLALQANLKRQFSDENASSEDHLDCFIQGDPDTTIRDKVLSVLDRARSQLLLGNGAFAVDSAEQNPSNWAMLEFTETIQSIDSLIGEIVGSESLSPNKNAEDKIVSISKRKLSQRDRDIASIIDVMKSVRDDGIAMILERAHQIADERPIARKTAK